MSYRIQKCRTPWCTTQLSIKVGNVNRKLLYCDDCKSQHEKQVLDDPCELPLMAGPFSLPISPDPRSSRLNMI